MQRFKIEILRHNQATEDEDTVKKLIKCGLENIVDSINFTKFVGEANTLNSWLQIAHVEVESDKRLYSYDIENELRKYNEYFDSTRVGELI